MESAARPGPLAESESTAEEVKNDLELLNKQFIAACGAFYKGKAVADLPTAERLFLLGADVNYCDSDGWPALFHAAGEGHLKVVEWLVEECSAAINLTTSEGITALWVACFNGKRNVAHVIVSLHIPVN